MVTKPQNGWVTPGCFISWTFPGGLSSKNDPCLVSGGYADPGSTSAFITIEDEYWIANLGQSVMVQIEQPQVGLGRTTFDATQMNDSNTVLGQTSTLTCGLGQSFVAQRAPAAKPVSSLSIDVLAERPADVNGHADVNGTIDANLSRRGRHDSRGLLRFRGGPRLAKDAARGKCLHPRGIAD